MRVITRKRKRVIMSPSEAPLILGETSHLGAKMKGKVVSFD